MKNLSILILKHFFLGLASLGEVKQSIHRNISFFLTIIDLEVILKELLGSADLTRAQAFCIHELTKVVLVSKNENLIFAAFKVMVLSLKSLNNG